MNSFGAIAVGIGLQDGLNPCIFMTCAVFILQGFWLKARSLKSIWLRVLFVLTYASSFLEFNFGRAQIFVLQKEFLFVSRIIYFILGIGTLILGVVFLKDWFLLSRKQSVKDLAENKVKVFTGSYVVMYFITSVLGVGLSALATAWPINAYIMLLGNTATLKGKWLIVMPYLSVYVLFSMWPLWFVWAFLSIKNLRPSMLKIFCASIFFTASACMILIFK